MIDGKRCVAVIQARLASDRFSYKVVNDLYTADWKNSEFITNDLSVESTEVKLPLIQSLVKRVLTLDDLDAVVVAFSNEKDVDVIKGVLCQDFDLRASSRLFYYMNRGIDEQDVLARIVRAAESLEADVVMRVTADCPLWCPGIGGDVLYEYFRYPYPKLYTTATHLGETFSMRVTAGDQNAVKLFVPHTQCPDGTDTEVVSLASLQKLNSGFVPMSYREHVTRPYYEGYEGWCPVKTSYCLPGVSSAMKLSVDTKLDLQNIREFYQRLMFNKSPQRALKYAIGPVTLKEGCYEQTRLF